MESESMVANGGLLSHTMGMRNVRISSPSTGKLLSDGQEEDPHISRR